jgi:hypothetical protein
MDLELQDGHSSKLENLKNLICSRFPHLDCEGDFINKIKQTTTYYDNRKCLPVRCLPYIFQIPEPSGFFDIVFSPGEIEELCKTEGVWIGNLFFWKYYAENLNCPVLDECLAIGIGQHVTEDTDFFIKNIEKFVKNGANPSAHILGDLDIWNLSDFITYQLLERDTLFKEKRNWTLVKDTLNELHPNNLYGRGITMFNVNALEVGAFTEEQRAKLLLLREKIEEFTKK